MLRQGKFKMRLVFDESNYKNVIGRIRKNFEAQGESLKITRGSLMNVLISSHADNSNSRHFLQVPIILESIRELSLGEEIMYSVLYAKAKYEFDRSPKGVYNSISEVEISIPQNVLKFKLRATDATIRKYYKHLETLGLLKIYKDSNNKSCVVRCMLDLEYISNDEFDAIINFIATNNNAYREITSLDYDMLDAYTGKDTRSEVAKIRNIINVSETHSNILSGNFGSDDSDLEKSERLEEVDKKEVKGVENEKSGKIVPLTEEFALTKVKEFAKAKAKEKALIKGKEEDLAKAKKEDLALAKTKRITESDIMLNDRKKDKDRKEYAETLALEKENAESIANPKEDMIDLNELVDW